MSVKQHHHPRRRVVRVTMADGSGGCDVYEPVDEPCFWCRATGRLWRDLTHNSRVCTACGHDWDHESLMQDHGATAANNDVTAQTVRQLNP